eukprot:6203177-Pleurochrysis_carterae.AAC.1
MACCASLDTRQKECGLQWPSRSAHSNTLAVTATHTKLKSCARAPNLHAFMAAAAGPPLDPNVGGL